MTDSSNMKDVSRFYSDSLPKKGFWEKMRLGEPELSSCQLWFIVALAARAVKTKEGREVIVSGHGTLGFLASGRLAETRF